MKPGRVDLKKVTTSKTDPKGHLVLIVIIETSKVVRGPIER